MSGYSNYIEHSLRHSVRPGISVISAKQILYLLQSLSRHSTTHEESMHSGIMLNYNRSHTFAIKHRNTQHPLDLVDHHSPTHRDLDQMAQKVLFFSLIGFTWITYSLHSPFLESTCLQTNFAVEALSIVRVEHSITMLLRCRSSIHDGQRSSMQWSSGFLNQNCNVRACFLHECDNMSEPLLIMLQVIGEAYVAYNTHSRKCITPNLSWS